MKSLTAGLWITVLLINLLSCSKVEDPVPAKDDKKEQAPDAGDTPVSYDNSYLIPSGKAGFVVMQSDGKVVMTGALNNISAPIFRLDKDGKLDPGFDIDQDKSWLIQSIQGLGVQPSGKVIVSGRFIVDKKAYDIIRLTETGLLDKTFKFHPIVENSSLTNTSMLIKSVQPDGKIICQMSALYQSLGYIMYGRFRMKVDGDSDSDLTSIGYKTFPGENTYGHTYTSFVTLPDNKTLVYGQFTLVDGNNRRRNIARLNADGSLDLSFNFKELPSQGNAVSLITSLAVQSDGKIIFSGNFNQLVDDSQRDTKYPLLNFCRLEKDGAVDLSFYVNKQPLSAGKILVRPDDSYIALLNRGNSGAQQIAVFGREGILKFTYKIADTNTILGDIFRQSENQYLITGNIIANGQTRAIARLTIK